MKRILMIIAAAILAALSMPFGVIAQTAAAALGEDAITYNSACGAPGVGMAYVGGYRDELQARDGKPGQHVNADGMWAECKMPPDCPRLAPKTRWQGGKPVTYGGLPEANIGRSTSQSIRTARNSRDKTVVKMTTRRMYCTAAGWADAPGG